MHANVNYGFEEPPSRFQAVAGVLFGGTVGLVIGFCAFFLATASARTIGAIFPRLEAFVLLSIYIAFYSMPALALLSIVRAPADGPTHGARVMAAVGLASLLVLAVGDMTDLLVIYPRGM